MLQRTIEMSRRECGESEKKHRDVAWLIPKRHMTDNTRQEVYAINKWIVDKEVAYGVCNDGTQFLIDVCDYPAVNQYNWWQHRGQIMAHVGRRRDLALSTFIIYGTDKATFRVRRRDCHRYDYRRCNLFSSNVYRIDGDIAYGKCFDGREFVVDVDQLDLLKRYIWHIDKNQYAITKVNGRVLKQHRLLMGIIDDHTIEVDHINGNTVDNRLSNLRLATRSQNCQNRRLGKANKSGTPGVYWMASAQKWAAQVGENGRRHYLGVFNTKEDAIAARHAAAKKYHGEFYC